MKKQKYLNDRAMADFRREINKQTLLGGRIFCEILIIFEIFMIVYSVFSFDFENISSKLYMASYIFLILMSAAILVFSYFYQSGKIKTTDNKIRGFIIAYLICLLLWSLEISAIDCISGGFCIAFLTISFGISGGVVLFPKEAGWLFGSAFILFIITSLSIKEIYFTFSSFINLFIYYSFIFIVSTMKYNNTLNDFVTRQMLKRQNDRYSCLIKELSGANEKLAEISETDKLTGVSSRSGMNVRFNLYMTDYNAPFALAMIDLDNFKTVNDTYGHTEGDKCLRGIAKILLKYFDKKDVFRYGGEEFLIMLPAQRAVAAKTMEQVRREIQSVHYGDYDIYMTISVGIYAVNYKTNESLYTCVNRADMALYNSKHNGKNRISLYD